MKALPLTAALVIGFAGGTASGRWLWPAAAPGTVASAGPAGSAAGSGSAVVKTENGSPLPAFDGTLESLRALAKAARSPGRAERSLPAALVAADAGQLGTLVAAFPWISSMPWEENAVYSALLEAWTEKDPDAAMRWTGTLPPHHQRAARSAMFKTLADVNFPVAQRLLSSVKNNTERHELQRTLASQLGLTDPQAALKLTASMGGQGMDASNTILSQWAGRNPQAAWAATQGLPSAQRITCGNSVLSRWAEKDPAAAQATAMGLPAGDRRTQALSSVFRGWANAAPAAAVAAAGALGKTAERKSAMRAAMGTWASSDPTAAWNAANLAGSRSERSPLQANILNIWAYTDPQSAAAAIAVASNTLQLDRLDRSNLLEWLGNNWGERDPEAAMTWARSLPKKDTGEIISRILRTFATHDPVAASMAWKSLTRSQQQSGLPGLMISWAGNDLNAALAFAQSMENPQDRSSAIQTCARELNFDEPGKIAGVFALLPAGPARVNAMRELAMHRSGNGESNETIAWMRTLPEQERVGILSGLDDYYSGEFSGHEAAAWADLMKDTPGSTAPQHFRSAVSAMAGEDPAATVQWASALDDPAQRKAALQAAISQWAEGKPSDAISAAQTLLDGQAQKDVMQSVIDMWSNQNPEALLAWAATATGEAREHALITGGLAKADYDAEAGAKIVEQFLHPQSGGKTSTAANNAAAQVATSWFSQNMDQGITWATGLPEGSARAAAVGSVVNEWIKIDPMAASQWASQLPAGESRDTAAVTLASAITQSDPESALAWAGSIASPSQREETMVRTLEAWRWQDKEAARTAAEKATLSETARTALLEKIGKQ